MGHIAFNDFDQTYHFNFSKETLKDKIVEQYCYDATLLSKNFGRTLIENPEVNNKYYVSIDEWLDKSNWDKHKADIRQLLSDTTDILFAKHHSRRSIQIRLIIDGDEKTSKLRVISLTADRRKEFDKSRDFYKRKFTKKIEKRFIKKLT